MGGGGSRWNHLDYHNFEYETTWARNGYYNAKQYSDKTDAELNELLRILGNEQQRIQAKALQDELTYQLKMQDIEWKIFQEKVREGQAALIASYYTNLVSAQLANLKEVVDQT